MACFSKFIKRDENLNLVSSIAFFILIQDKIRLLTNLIYINHPEFFKTYIETNTFFVSIPIESGNHLKLLQENRHMFEDYYLFCSEFYYYTLTTNSMFNIWDIVNQFGIIGKYAHDVLGLIDFSTASAAEFVCMIKNKSSLVREQQFIYIFNKIIIVDIMKCQGIDFGLIGEKFRNLLVVNNPYYLLKKNFIDSTFFV